VEYSRLGKAGIQVSELSLGTSIDVNRLQLPSLREILTTAFDHGINSFDTAEAYVDTIAESQLGRAIKCFRREELVISSKVFYGEDYNFYKQKKPNLYGLSWKHIVEGCKNSLHRLDTDYLDIYYWNSGDSNFNST